MLIHKGGRGHHPSAEDTKNCLYRDKELRGKINLPRHMRSGILNKNRVTFKDLLSTINNN